MRIPSVAHTAWLLIALTSACGSKSEDSARTSKSSEESSRSAKSGQAKEGSPPLGTFTCKAVKDNACTTATDHFDGSTEAIHVIYTTKDMPKKGDVYLTKWIADDVGDAAPANTVLASHESTVSDVDAAYVSYTVEGQVSRPTKGWPKGSYHVEVLLDEKVVTSAKFKIE